MYLDSLILRIKIRPYGLALISIFTPTKIRVGIPTLI